MKELLYKKSEAVAALNRVDGFHPMELARKITQPVSSVSQGFPEAPADLW